MKIIYLNWASFGSEDVFDTIGRMREAGEDITLIKYPFEKTDRRRDEAFEKKFSETLREERADIVFSFNYFPVVAETVHAVYEECGTRYVSWVYDCPHIVLYSCTLVYPSNDVFLFDSAMYKTFALQGIETVHYLPLAANVRRLDAMQVTGEIWQKYQSRISFVGAMYTEKGTFYDRMEKDLDPYAKGYLEGLMQAQMQVNGLNFIEEAITPQIETYLQKALPVPGNADGVETAAWTYAQYFVNRKITQTERALLLAAIGERFPVVLYTHDKSFSAKGVQTRAAIDYYDTMPYVFKCSDINLNITLRSITAGIPLRAFDIMGAGGFLLTSYQPDMDFFFTAGEDYVYYESKEDLLQKIDYYLTHESERKEIAKNACEKIAAAHTFDVRLREILDVVGEKR